MKINNFPVTGGDIHRKILVVDSSNNIFTGSFYPKDEFHSEDECALDWHNDGFEGSSFYPAKYLKGWIEFPELNEKYEEMDIELTKPNDFKRKLEYLINSYGYDAKLHTPDFIIADYLSCCLGNLWSFRGQDDKYREEENANKI